MFIFFPANIRLDEEVSKTSFVCVFRRFFETSWWRWIYSPKSNVFRRRVQHVLVKITIFVLVIRLQDVKRRRYQDVFKKSCQNVFKMYKNVFKTYSRRLQHNFKTCHQVKLFLLTSLQDVFNTFLKHTAKTVIWERICLSHTSEKFMFSVQNLEER